MAAVRLFVHSRLRVYEAGGVISPEAACLRVNCQPVCVTLSYLCVSAGKISQRLYILMTMITLGP